MKHTFYIIKDRSLDKDKVPESVIAKYDGARFLAAMPLPRFAKIDDGLFNKAPRIPKKNVEYVLTKQDLNKDGVKDIVISVFNKGKYIVSVPYVPFVFKKTEGKSKGGNPEQMNHSEIRQDTPPHDNLIINDATQIKNNETDIIIKNQTGIDDSRLGIVAANGLTSIIMQIFNSFVQ